MTELTFRGPGTSRARDAAESVNKWLHGKKAPGARLRRRLAAGTVKLRENRVSHVVPRRKSPLGYCYLRWRAVGTTKPRGKKVVAKEKPRGHAKKTFENHSRSK